MMDNNFKTPIELGHIIALNLRVRRKARKLSLSRLSEISGVSYGSIKRFESSGEISLISLLKIAVVLECTDEFEQLFADAEQQSRAESPSIQEATDGEL